MSDNRRVVCWQGWQIAISRRWDPVKLEGDHAEGYALFADALRPRLGLRWQTLGKKQDDPAAAVKLAMRNEVGKLAADEAREVTAVDPPLIHALLYTEPQPPGRDIYSVYSEASNRLLQVAYHAHRRENVLAAQLLPALADLPVDAATPWSIFDLNCVIPGGMSLRSQRLNAGDLGLTFADKFQEVTVRQIAVAQVALQRQSLDRWIVDQQAVSKRFHQSTGLFADTKVGQHLARISHMHRRLRYAWMWKQPQTFTTIALHDESRDRLVIVHGTEEGLLREIALTVGTL